MPNTRKRHLLPHSAGLGHTEGRHQSSTMPAFFMRVTLAAHALHAPLHPLRKVPHTPSPLPHSAELPNSWLPPPYDTSQERRKSYAKKARQLRENRNTITRKKKRDYAGTRCRFRVIADDTARRHDFHATSPCPHLVETRPADPVEQRDPPPSQEQSLAVTRAAHCHNRGLPLPERGAAHCHNSGLPSPEQGASIRERVGGKTATAEIIKTVNEK